MNTKHTPGPWAARKDSSGKVTVYSTQVPGLGTICKLGCWPIDEEDARLIAAAPELLEALKSIVDTHFSLADLTPQHWKIAQAAIAKAQGRE